MARQLSGTATAFWKALAQGTLHRYLWQQVMELYVEAAM
jgi:hypothetical protein